MGKLSVKYSAISCYILPLIASVGNTHLWENASSARCSPSRNPCLRNARANPRGIRDFSRAVALFLRDYRNGSNNSLAASDGVNEVRAYRPLT